MTAIPLGEPCRECGRDEACCAKEGVCCLACTHFRHLDVNGNPYEHRPPPRMRRALELTPIHTARRAALDRAVAVWEAEQAQQAALRAARPVRHLLPHGTHTAFNRHRNYGTEPCPDCWAAERDYQRERKRESRRRMQDRGATA